jgi:pimeloyl-ACP methyl ester carboxylesterase
MLHPISYNGPQSLPSARYWGARDGWCHAVLGAHGAAEHSRAPATIAYRVAVTKVLLLPGIIAPAPVRYAPLLAELPGVQAVPKDLELYRDTVPPKDYSMATEIDGVNRAADSHGFREFHLYGHSAGGAVALAYVAAQPDRVLSLALDEPATDFTDEGHRTYGWEAFDRALTLPEGEGMAAFLRLQVADDVELSAPPGPLPPAMTNRPAGIRAFIAAARRHRVDSEAYRRFTAPVYFSMGGRTHPRWTGIRDRLAELFPDFTAEVYEELHHLNTSHQAQPERVAATLRRLWTRAEHKDVSTRPPPPDSDGSRLST